MGLRDSSHWVPSCLVRGGVRGLGGKLGPLGRASISETCLQEHGVVAVGTLISEATPT